MSNTKIDEVREATTPNEMRSEIARLSRFNHLVRKSFDYADFAGLSAEDRYTVLSYYALDALVKTQNAMHEYLVTTPRTQFVMPADSKVAT